eukprot:SAG25_NODE_11007_length_316_cov_1.382488_1_plen_31_part_10
MEREGERERETRRENHLLGPRVFGSVGFFTR